jgi:hypothetical protein
MKRVWSGFVICLMVGAAWAQSAKQPRMMGMQVIKDTKPVICFAGTTDMPANLPPPAEYIKWKNAGANARTKSAQFEVTYEGFTPEAQAAFQEAVNIWSTLIESPVPIRIRAQWTQLPANVLGGAQAGGYVGNFFGAPRINVWYPIALAEKLLGRAINPDSQPDISASFSSSANWHYGLADAPPAGRFDLLTVVLHEIGHGLGITHGFSVADGSGSLAISGFPVVYHSFMENGNAQNLVSNFPAPSANLGTQLTGQDLYWNSPLVLANNSNQRGRLYAPATFAPGNSIAHLDEETYSFPATNPNRLMTPFISPAERALDPGPIALNMLYDLGWRMLRIEHTPLPNTENVSAPYPVTARVITENGVTYDAASVRLQYTTNGTSFTSVPMTATGTANEFRGFIPTGNASYGYTISVTDGAQRVRTIPGQNFPQNQPSRQLIFGFTAGPDTQAPIISHVPKGFVKLSDGQLTLEAEVTDNINVQNVTLEYSLNGAALQTLPMTIKPDTDSTYVGTISWTAGQLADGNRIEYRIRARDVAAAQNQSGAPTLNTFYSVNVVALTATQDSYANNFNNISTAAADFFGDAGFSIKLESGFADGAIHTQHPYPEGQGFPNNRFEWVYQLRVPIRVKATDATVQFDEVVLVEPGEPGSTFPSEEFYDYVVVDGSKDGGVTWTTVANGYDSRDFGPWLTRYNSAITANISTAVGDPTLFRNRVLNLQDKFDTGDEVVLRFRLFSDPGAAGWGWAIDNLKIQIDDAGPRVLHNHLDILLPTAANLPVVFRPSDPSGLKSLFVDFSLNNGPVSSQQLPVAANVNEYTLNIDLSAAQIKVGDVLQYRIRATDNADNATNLPATGFFNVAVVSLAQPLNLYVSDFNTANTDFAGNFFSIAQPAGFGNGAIHSQHPYPVGFGISNQSAFSYILKRPIRVSGNNPLMVFDEIVVAEFTGAAVKDFVAIEGSKDGATWETIVPAYSSNVNAPWGAAFNTISVPNSALFRQRLVNLTESGRFRADDVILLRFRLQSDDVRNGWGWAIDNLSIQGPITGLEASLESDVHVYPIPANEQLVIEVGGAMSVTRAQVVTLQGRSVWANDWSSSGQPIRESVNTRDWPAGMYLVQIQTEAGVATRKVLVQH